jgi:hypothetical protein
MADGFISAFKGLKDERKERKKCNLYIYYGTG